MTSTVLWYSLYVWRRVSGVTFLIYFSVPKFYSHKLVWRENVFGGLVPSASPGHDAPRSVPMFAICSHQTWQNDIDSNSSTSSMFLWLEYPFLSLYWKAKTLDCKNSTIKAIIYIDIATNWNAQGIEIHEGGMLRLNKLFINCRLQWSGKRRMLPYQTYLYWSAEGSTLSGARLIWFPSILF